MALKQAFARSLAAQSASHMQSPVAAVSHADPSREVATDVERPVDAESIGQLIWVSVDGIGGGEMNGERHELETVRPTQSIANKLRSVACCE